MVVAAGEAVVEIATPVPSKTKESPLPLAKTAICVILYLMDFFSDFFRVLSSALLFFPNPGISEQIYRLDHYIF